jgi:hypothetical protein
MSSSSSISACRHRVVSLLVAGEHFIVLPFDPLIYASLVSPMAWSPIEFFCVPAAAAFCYCVCVVNHLARQFNFFPKLYPPAMQIYPCLNPSMPPWPSINPWAAGIDLRRLHHSIGPLHRAVGALEVVPPITSSSPVSGRARRRTPLPLLTVMRS